MGIQEQLYALPYRARRDEGVSPYATNPIVSRVAQRNPFRIRASRSIPTPSNKDL